MIKNKLEVLMSSRIYKNTHLNPEESAVAIRKKKGFKQYISFFEVADVYYYFRAAINIQALRAIQRMLGRD